MMTQEQANAIAEREYPINYVTDTDNIILCEKLKRKAYAKALMDMNPLIEAVESITNALSPNTLPLNSEMDDRHKAQMVREVADQCFDMARIALANLTKSIESST